MDFPTTCRRRFLQTLSTTAAAASLPSLWADLCGGADSPAGERIPVVDTHQHLWDLDVLTLPWLQKEAVQPINRNFVMSDYLQATRDANVVKSIYMEVNVKPDHQQREAEYVLDLCRRDDNPMVAAIIGGYPFADDFRAYIEPLSQHNEIRGVRTVLHDPDRKRGLCLEPQFVRGIELLGKLGRTFDLCMRPDEVIDGVKLAEKCPQTRFIVDHCGNMSVTSTDRKLRQQWMEGIRAAADQENMACKISGIVVTAKEGVWKPVDLAPNMEFCMEAFGEDRVFFGGDWPVCTLKASFIQWLDALKWIVRERSPEFKQKLFHDNALAWYRVTS